ncbi:MAG: proprotein convertase P-domain-containing protein, partial [Bacteroidales bacterium]|nr:proprotein convertase P-domain-containing protein [Bacteroidales bacterium]
MKTFLLIFSLILLTNFVFGQNTIDLLDGTIVTECSGTFYDSGGQTGAYSNDEDFSFTISPTGATTVILTMNSFDVQSNPSCAFDFLSIYDGTSNGDPLIGKYCNNSFPPTTISSTGGSLFIVWHSDGSNVFEGFDITWKSGNFINSAIFVTNEIECNGDGDGEITVSAFGVNPLTYSWDDPSSQTTATATGLDGGTYSVTITDGNSCSTVESIILEEPDPISASSTVNNILCNGDCDGDINVIPSGGVGTFSYIWGKNFSFVGSTGQIINNTSNQRFSAVVTGLGPNLDGTTLLLDRVCLTIDHDQSEDLDIYLEYPIGTQIVLVEDEGGSTSGDFNDVCFTMASTLEIASAGDAPFSGDYNPEGDLHLFENNQDPNGTWFLEIDETHNGGIDGSLLSWRIEFVEILPDITSSAINLCAANYSVQISDANFCKFTHGLVSISEPSDPLNVSIVNQVNVLCENDASGSALAVATNGTPNYSYQWDISAGSQTTQIANNLEDGTYFVTVTDDNGCTQTASATITEPTSVTANITSSTNVGCNGASTGSATVTAGGG